MLEILQQCPELPDGILAARLSEGRRCPQYDLGVEQKADSDDQSVDPIPRNAKLVAALIETSSKSRCESEGGGFKVVTDKVADASCSMESDVDDSGTVVAHCSVTEMLNFKLDPARNATSRAALVLICAVETIAFTGTKICILHAAEHVEADQVENARTVMKKLRKFAMCVRSDPQESLKRI